MRIRPLVLAGLCLWLTVAGAASPEKAPPGWQEIDLPAARFKVLMPGAPKTSRQTIRTDIGNVVSTRYTVTDAANVTYDVMFNDYPAAGISRTNPQKLLDGARDGLVYQTKGRMIGDKHITLTGFPGRDQEILAPDGTHYRIRLVWTENRLYQIMAVTPGQPRPESSVFFDSFRVAAGR
jgi:hypothetical protein